MVKGGGIMFKVAPLSSSFMLVSMLGFMIVIIYTGYGRIPLPWGFALGFVFALMFIASIISMTFAPARLEMEIDKRRKIKK